MYRKIGNKQESPRDHLYIDVKIHNTGFYQVKVDEGVLNRLEGYRELQLMFRALALLAPTRSREFSCNSFFWDYSGMRIHGIGGNCVLLGPILIPE